MGALVGVILGFAYLAFVVTRPGAEWEGLGILAGAVFIFPLAAVSALGGGLLGAIIGYWRSR